MTLTDLNDIKESIEDGYRATGKTGKKVPPNVGNGWRRTVELRRGTEMNIQYVSADDWTELTSCEWFPYDA